MMGHRQVEQAALFYEFSLERHIPADHLLRSIDRFFEFGDLRRDLAPFYSAMGRPSVDPELMIRMLIVGYCFGIRSERRLCEEVHLNLAYRWFCRLGRVYELGGPGVLDRSERGRSSKFRRQAAFPSHILPGRRDEIRSLGRIENRDVAKHGLPPAQNGPGSLAFRARRGARPYIRAALRSAIPRALSVTADPGFVWATFGQAQSDSANGNSNARRTYGGRS
jgi:Transposase domain (DUF772)